MLNIPTLHLAARFAAVALLLAGLVLSTVIALTVPAKAATPWRELKHPGTINALAISPDGALLASVTPVTDDDKKTTGQIHLWSLKDSQLLRTWTTSQSWVKSLDFSPDSQILASGGNTEVHLWDVASGRTLKILSGHHKDVMKLKFSPDGKTLACGGYRMLVLWNLESGDKREIGFGETGNAGAITFSADGRWLAASLNNEAVAGLWDSQTLQLKQTFTAPGKRGHVASLALSPDGSTLATGDLGHNLLLWDIASGKPKATLLQLKPDWDFTGPSGKVMGLAFGADGQTLVSAGGDQEGPGGYAELLLWDWQKGERRAALLDPPVSSLWHFAAAPDAVVFATAEALNPVVQVWRLTDVQKDIP